MQFLLFFAAILLSAISSSVLTVILLRRYLTDLGTPQKSLNKAFEARHTVSKKEVLNTCTVSQKIDILDERVGTGHTIFESLMEGEKTKKESLLTLVKVFLKKITKRNFSTSNAIRFVGRSCVGVIAGLILYCVTLGKIALSVPFIFIAWIYSDAKQVVFFCVGFISYLFKIIKKLLTNYWGYTVASFLALINKIHTAKNTRSQEDFQTKQRERGVEQKKTIAEKKDPMVFSETATLHNSAESKHHFLLETVGVVIFAFLIFTPFISKAQEVAPGYFFFYHIAILIFGSFILLKHSSPRVFWAIGVMEWVSVFLWFFSWYKDTYLFSATVFLTIFVCIYGFSSYLWYGIKDREYVNIEYALFILHPFLYMAAVYLLLIGLYKYIVGILFTMIALIYIFFARSLYKEDKTKNILYICLFIASIAILSCVSILLNGIFLLVGLSLLSVWVLWFSNFYQVRTTLYVIPILIYSIGYTLSSTNTAKDFLPVVNMRFFGYMVTVGTLLLVSAYIKKIFKRNHSVGYKYLYSSLFWFSSVLFATAVTLDLVDARQHTSILHGIRADIARAVFYIAFSIYLYLQGNKKSSRSLQLASVTISLYTIIYILGTFLF